MTDLDAETLAGEAIQRATTAERKLAEAFERAERAEAERDSLAELLSDAIEATKRAEADHAREFALGVELRRDLAEAERLLGRAQLVIATEGSPELRRDVPAFLARREEK